MSEKYVTPDVPNSSVESREWPEKSLNFFMFIKHMVEQD